MCTSEKSQFRARDPGPLRARRCSSRSTPWAVAGTPSRPRCARRSATAGSTAGARLPSTRALAADLGLARGTIAEAYAQLQAEGYLTARRGGGTWVGDVAAAALPRRPRALPATRARASASTPGCRTSRPFRTRPGPSALRRGLRETPATSLGYGDPRGRPELSAALADYLARVRGVVVNPDLIVVCGGFRHGLSLVARVLRAHGARRVAMEEPGLNDHHDVLVAAGLEADAAPRRRARCAHGPARRDRRGRHRDRSGPPVPERRPAPPRAARRGARLGARRRRPRDRGRLRRRAALRPPAHRRAAGPRPRARRLWRHDQQDARTRPEVRLDRPPCGAARAGCRAA